MIFIKFRVRPNASTVKFTQYGGAYIGCWIKIGSKKVAEARALAKILEEGRIVEHREELKVLKAPYPAKAKKFIERAKVEGLSFITFTRPAGPQKSEKVP